VIGLGWSDLDAGVSVARSRLNLANILDRAANLHVPALVTGPPPRRAEEEAQIAAYSNAFAEVAERRQTPYVEMFTPLSNHEQWLEDMTASGHTWPNQYGYGLMAWLVLNTHWADWLK
jgi:acyl-CoA thioesterase I